MTNVNFVCFDCRISQRRSCLDLVASFQLWIVGSIGDGTILCPECKRPSRFLGDRIAVPPKRDDNGWKQLREYANERLVAYREQNAQADTRRKHDIERRMLELQARPENKDRDRLIKYLRAELERLAST